MLRPSASVWVIVLLRTLILIERRNAVSGSALPRKAPPSTIFAYRSSVGISPLRRRIRITSLGRMGFPDFLIHRRDSELPWEGSSGGLAPRYATRAARNALTRRSAISNFCSSSRSILPSGSSVDRRSLRDHILRAMRAPHIAPADRSGCLFCRGNMFLLRVYTSGATCFGNSPGRQKMKPFDSTNQLFVPKLTRCVVRTATSRLKSVCCSIAPRTPKIPPQFPNFPISGVSVRKTTNPSIFRDLSAA
jgi:hypothetical protein